MNEEIKNDDNLLLFYFIHIINSKKTRFLFSVKYS